MACALAVLAACSSPRPRSGPPTAPPGTRGAPETSLPQSERYRQAQDSGPLMPPAEVAKLPEPVPKVEPRARYGNKATYVVLGKTYHVLASADGYDERGIASWYGDKFHGYMTSMLEPYDMYKFTAAHKTLPLPSYAEVTNLANGKSVIVRINDRGPFVPNRIIDLSYAAAVRIGIWPAGTGLVEVRAIDPANPGREPPPIRQVRTGGSPEIYLQVGAYSDARNAQRVADAARRAGIRGVSIVSASVGGRTVHRVRVGPLPDAASADAMSPRLAQLGFGAPRVAIER